MTLRVLLMSQRRLTDLVAFCVGYEFEDVIAETTGAERIDVDGQTALDFTRRWRRLARMTTGSPDLAATLTPPPRRYAKLTNDYDLFFPVFSHTHQIHTLSYVPNWRERSKVACVYISECWTDLLPGYMIEQLAQFDRIFLGTANAVDDVARLTGRPCSHLLPASDTVRFAPRAPDLPRPIDVAYIGRRSHVTHEALLAASRSGGLFYYYDTVAASGSDMKDRTFRVDRPAEHRHLLAQLLNHSRFFFANRGYANRPEFAGRNELSARFFEGAAAGTFMIGDVPKSPAFSAAFDWPDAVVPIPFDAPDIVQILTDLQQDFARLHAAQRMGVTESARRHDWLHRLTTVFDAVGLAPTPGMIERERRLADIASRFASPVRRLSSVTR